MKGERESEGKGEKEKGRDRGSEEEGGGLRGEPQWRAPTGIHC